MSRTSRMYRLMRVPLLRPRLARESKLQHPLVFVMYA